MAYPTLADRVKELSHSTGTGAVSLDGAFTGYQTFAQGIGLGMLTYYCISHNDFNAFEVGIGYALSSPPRLIRQQVLASSNANALVDFVSGEKEVFVTYPAGKSILYPVDSASPLAFSGSVEVLQNLIIDGNLFSSGSGAFNTVTAGQFIGPIASSSFATSASFASSASYGKNSTSSSFATSASAATSLTFVPASSSYSTSGSYATNASAALTALTAISASAAINSITSSLSSFAISAATSSIATSSSYAGNSNTANTATTSSLALLMRADGLIAGTASGDFVFNGNMQVTQTLTANVVSFISSSVVHASGSTSFGTSPGDVMSVTGSIDATETGSFDSLVARAHGLRVVGPVVLPVASIADSALSSNIPLKNVLNAFTDDQVIAQDKRLRLSGTSVNTAEVATSWAQGYLLMVNLDYTGSISTDPLLSLAYTQNPGTNNIGGGYLRFDANAQKWSVGIAPTSPGSGSAASPIQYFSVSPSVVAINSASLRMGATDVIDTGRNILNVNISASLINGGTLNDLRLSSNVAMKNANILMTSDGAFSIGALNANRIQNVWATGTGSFGMLSGSFVGEGSRVTGIITSSFASVTPFANLTGKPTLFSSSVQVDFGTISNTPTLVSSSAQINFAALSGLPTLVSSSAQINFLAISNVPALVSSSTQISFTSIINKPTLVSSSNQIAYSGITGVPGDLFRTGSGTTTTITEGTNLYYSDVRVKTKMDSDAVVSSSAQIRSQISSIGPSVTYDNSTGIISSSVTLAALNVNAGTFQAGTYTFPGAVNVGSLVETSSRNLKTDIILQSNQLNKVLKLRPVDFTWRSTGVKDKGFIAEEFEFIYPEFVGRSPEGEITGINYSKMVSVLTRTIQELHERIEQLERHSQRSLWRRLIDLFRLPL